MRLDVLHRNEAVAFLRHRTGGTDAATLADLAEALGDLPLALEQAAAYMDETHTTPAAYLALYRKYSAELLALGDPLTTEQTVATTWQVALGQLRATPGAQDLLSLCAFLAPDDIPRALVGQQGQVLPEPLRGLIERPLAYNQAVAALGRYSLVTVTTETLTVHHLVQAVVRASLSTEDQRRWAGVATLLVNAAFPRGSNDPATWMACALLLPHALAAARHAEALGVEPERMAAILIEAAVYLWSRGHYRQAMTLEEQAPAANRRMLGKDHRHTLTAMNNLAVSRRALGDLQGAHDLHEEALITRWRVLGPDHPETLSSMNNLAETRRALGDLQGPASSMRRP